MTQPRQESPTHFFWYSVAALTLLACVTRFWGLGEWNLYRDEIFTALFADERRWSLINPAYYWLEIASVHVLGPTDFAIRLPSALLGAASIPLFMILWWRLIGQRAALFGALVLLLCSWHLHHSQNARFYACVLFFASMSYALYFSAIKKDSIPLLVGSIAAGVAAFLFHATAALVLGSSLLYTILATWGPASGRFASSRRFAMAHIGIAVAGALIALPAAMGQLSLWTEEGLAPPGPITWTLRFIRAAGLPELLLAASGWLLLWRSDRRLATFIGLGIGLPLAGAFAGAAVMGMRNDYVFGMVPLLAVCGGVFLDRVSDEMPGALKWAIPSLLLLLLSPALASHYLDKSTLDVREVIGFVKANFRPGDTVIPYANEFEYYAPPELSLGDRLLSMRPEEERDWVTALDPLLQRPTRTWLVLRETQTPLPAKLERWLRANAQLSWRKASERLDMQVRGYEVWLVNPKAR